MSYEKGARGNGVCPQYELIYKQIKKLQHKYNSTTKRIGLSNSIFLNGSKLTDLVISIGGSQEILSDQDYYTNHLIGSKLCDHQNSFGHEDLCSLSSRMRVVCVYSMCGIVCRLSPLNRVSLGRFQSHSTMHVIFNQKQRFALSEQA